MENRTTIVIGNGLGLALDADHFTLAAAMEEAWKTLDPDAKSRMSHLVENGEKPKNENDLPEIQEVIFALKTLKRYEKEDKPWLHEKADVFLNVYQQYVLEIGKYFFNFEVTSSVRYKKFVRFMDSLCGFIVENKPHIATLNYDKILYSHFIDKRIVDGYDGELCDGMLNLGFQRENLDRRYGKNFGWYLHLHGSPLFYSEKDETISSHIRDINENKPRDHLVLNHSKYKPAVISKSILLAAYWDCFNLALQESNKVVLFGYSGCDEHINNAIKEWRGLSKDKSRTIEIIEWKGAGNKVERKEYWQEKIPDSSDRKNILKREQLILDHRF